MTGLVAEGGALRRALAYPRLRRASCAALVIDSGYHLQQECCDALQVLGHRVVRLDVRSTVHDVEGGASAMMAQLLQALVAHRPDFVLSVNHIGFDAAGTIGDVLDAVRMPTAVWYVDSPFFVLRGGAFPARAMTSLFVWDKGYMPLLRAAGADDLAYLPLGCDIRKFSHTPQAPERAVSFVGDSMVAPLAKWRARLSRAESRTADKLKVQVLQNRRQPPWLQRRGNCTWDTCAAAAFRATAEYRRAILQRATDGPLHVYGDAGWRDVLPEATYGGPVMYGAALAHVYRTSAVNLNATSLQMPMAVNQRVFDVPAAGGFVLSDAQDAVGELFEVGTEAVVYGNHDDVGDLWRFYARHDSARQRVVSRAYMRICREHTYAARLAVLVQHLRRRHGMVQPC